MPGTIVKTNALDLLDRIEITAQLLGSMMHEFQVRGHLQSEYGVCRRTCNSYIARARLLIQRRTGRSRFDHRMEAEAFYRAELQRSNEPMVRIKCRERLDSIHGVDARYEDGPARAPASETTINVTINVAGLSADKIEELVERGEPLDPKSIEHLPRGDRLRILRKAAQAYGSKE